MVTRVSTTGNYASILSNLMNAQLRQFDANERVSSQKNGNDLKDYAKKAETPRPRTPAARAPPPSKPKPPRAASPSRGSTSTKNWCASPPISRRLTRRLA